MKTILLWDLRFRDRSPMRLTLADEVAAASVRAGVAAAANPAEQGALAAGGPLDAGSAVEILIQHGVSQRTRRVTVPISVATVAVQLGVATSTGAPIAIGPIALSMTGAPAFAFVGSTTPFAPAITGGTAPYALSLASGTLPGGRAIDGLSVTGTYTTAGTFTPTLRVTDSKGATADLALSVPVAAALGPTTASFTAGAAAGTVATAIAGLAAGETLTGVTPNDGRLAVSSGSLVVGLTASSAGSILASVTTSAGRTLEVTVTVGAGVAPINWRQPATVTTSSDLAGSQAALADAQASASSKARPKFTVTSGQTSFIDYALPATTTPTMMTIFAVSGFDPAEIAITDAGVAKTFTTVAPAGQGLAGRQQRHIFPAGPARTVRIAIAATATRLMRVLLYSLPESGPSNTIAVIGASREVGMTTEMLENACIAEMPDWDGVFFHLAVSATDPNQINAGQLPVLPNLQGHCSYAFTSSYLGNWVTQNHPYDASEKAALDGFANALADAAASAGMKLVLGNTSTRLYNAAAGNPQPYVTLDNLLDGAAGYNINQWHAFVAARAPDSYDASLGRSKMDEEACTLFYRNSAYAANDPVHGASSQVAALGARTVFRFIAKGVWGTPEYELRAGTLEATPLIENYNEAIYMLRLFDQAKVGYAALATRVAAKRIPASVGTADQKVFLFETAKTQATKDVANTAITDAVNAGATGSPYDAQIAALRDRVGKVTITTDVEVQLNFGTTSQSNWNSFSAVSGGVKVANLIDKGGQATGMSLTVTGSGGSVDNGFGKTTGDNSGIYPDQVLLSCMRIPASGRIEIEVGPIPDGKVVDVDFLGSSVANQYNAFMRVGGDALADTGGVETTPALLTQNNVSEVRKLTNAPIVVNADGKRVMRGRFRQSSSGNGPITGARITLRNA